MSRDSRGSHDTPSVDSSTGPLDRLQALAENPRLNEVETLLRAFARSLRGSDSLSWGIARERAIAALQGKVNAPAKLVDAALRPDPAKARETEAQGTPLRWEDPEPWPAPVDGAELLAAISALFSRYLALPEGAATALALWVVFAHAHDAAEISPVLALCSPEKRCGKTRALEILASLAPRPLSTSNVTPAVVFRTVESFSPTLLIDEADTFLTDRHELRGILNSGHTRSGAFVLRNVGEDHEPRHFTTWAPKAVAMIGRLPSTLEDRAIVLRLHRKAPDEHIESLRHNRLESEAEPLRRQVARWSAEHLDELAYAEPEMPAGLDDRAADNWRLLLGIADLAGGAWPREARTSALELIAGRADDDSSEAIQLLGDVRELFEASGEERLFTDELIRGLAAREDRPWREWRQTRQWISPVGIARLLSRFGIKPRQFRRGAANRKGYVRGELEDSFRRYLPTRTETSETMRS